jgi:hypothetical protein
MALLAGITIRDHGSRDGGNFLERASNKFCRGFYVQAISRPTLGLASGLLTSQDRELAEQKHPRGMGCLFGHMTCRDWPKGTL